MAKKLSNPYSKVDFSSLKVKIGSLIEYLKSEPANEHLSDSYGFKQTANGGIVKVVTTKIEEKLETQVTVLDSCSKIVAVIYEKEGMTDFLKDAIESLIEKLAEIERYYDERPASGMVDRIIYIPTSRADIEVVACSKEGQIKCQAKITEKILKMKPLFTDLEEKKEVALKRGVDMPAFMLI